MKEAYIYTYVNKITKKTYIGSRSFYKTSAEEDFNNKYKSSSKNKEFISDMQAGLLEGQIILIIKCENANKRIVELEHKMIQAYWNTYGKENSYNHYCNGKFSVAGLKHSEETKQHWSEIRSGENSYMYGKHLSEKQIEVLKSRTGENNPAFGKEFSEDHKNKISQSLKGRSFSEEHKRHLSESHKGKHLSEEAKKKVSEAQKGKIVSEETKEKMRQYRGEKHHLYGRIMSDEEKERLRKINTGSKQSQETKDKIKNSLLGKQKPKYKFLDENGIIHEITRVNAKRWHPSWIEVKENT